MLGTDEYRKQPSNPARLDHNAFTGALLQSMVRACNRPIRLRAKGTKKWHAKLKAPLKPARYRVFVVAVDRAGNLERRARRNSVTFRIR